MANKEHLEILDRGKSAWNNWRKENPSIKPDLSGIVLEKYVKGINSILQPVGPVRNEPYSSLRNDFKGYNFSNTILDEVSLRNQNLSSLILNGSSMKRCDLSDQLLKDINLEGVNLSGANLKNSRILNTNISNSVLVDADLRRSTIIETNLSHSDLSGCMVFGISAWNLELAGSTQEDIIITKEDETLLTVDNIKVAQFVYQLINNAEIRDVIDTITSKAVLILGRFTKERKVILNAIREQLRKCGYLPILFDFDKPKSRNLTETVKTLAYLSKFIIVDISNPRSVPHELANIIPNLTSVPVQPVIHESQNEYGMFQDFMVYPWVLEMFRYKDKDHLLTNFENRLLNPAENILKTLSR